MKKLWTLFFLLLQVTVWSGSLEDWSKMLAEDKAVGLDIRTSPELFLNSAKGAKHVSYIGFSKEKIEKLKIGKNKTILIFCESGGRASSALNDLKKWGYTNVINIRDWRTWNKIKKND